MRHLESSFQKQMGQNKSPEFIIIETCVNCLNLKFYKSIERIPSPQNGLIGAMLLEVKEQYCKLLYQMKLVIAASY